MFIFKNWAVGSIWGLNLNIWVRRVYYGTHESENFDIQTIEIGLGVVAGQSSKGRGEG